MIKSVYEFTISDIHAHGEARVQAAALEIATQDAVEQGYELARVEVERIQDSDSLDNVDVYQVKVYKEEV